MSKKPIRPKIDIEITFDQGFACVKNFSDREFDFKFQGLDGTIFFPKINPETTQDSRFSSDTILPPSTPDLNLDWHSKIPWGNIYSYPYECFHVQKLYAWIYLPAKDQVDEEIKNIYLSIPAWRDLLQLYIEILTKVSLRYVEPTVSPVGRFLGIGMWKMIDGKNVHQHTFYSPGHTIVIDKHPCICQEAFIWVLNRLATLEPPPIEYQILNEARIDCKNNSLPKAVIQASTAIELVFDKLLMELIVEKTSAKFYKLVGNKATLGRKLALLEALNLDISKFGYNQDHIKYRNDVAHRWIAPSKREVYELIEMAEQILDHYSPLVK